MDFCVHLEKDLIYSVCIYVIVLANDNRRGKVHLAVKKKQKKNTSFKVCAYFQLRKFLPDVTLTFSPRAKKKALQH